MPRFVTTTLCVLILLATSSLAQQPATSSVPNLIRYDGTLKEIRSAAVSSVTFGVTFAIYKQEEGGAPIWMETQNVTPDRNGSYTVLLGSATANGLPGDLFSQHEQRWLGVQVQGQEEQPRTLLVSVPYAVKAQEAETLGGLPASAFVKAPSSDTSGNATDGATAAGSQNAGNGQGASKVGGPDTVINCVGAQNGRIAVFSQSLPPNITICNSGIYEATPYGSGAIGILNPNPVAPLDVNGNINTNAAYLIGMSNAISVNIATGNVAIGPIAGSAASGMNNTFVGFGVGQSNSTGTGNTFSGTGAGNANTTGFANSYYGQGAGISNTIGNHNSFFGSQTGWSNVVSDNTFYGYNAGFNTVTGSNNTFVGSMAGYPNGTGGGSFNTAIGFAAGPSPSQNITNATAIGANAVVSASNALVLGGTGSSAVAVGIGTTAPTSALDIVGTLKLEGQGNGIVFPDGTEQTTAASASGGVTSWNGRTGAVVPQSGDYNFPKISGTLGSSQFSGTYSQAVALSNTSNVYYGDGSHLTGIPASHSIAACVSYAQSPPGCACRTRIIYERDLYNGDGCMATSDTGSCTGASSGGPFPTYGSCCVCAGS
jgi:hypothetical protein